MKKLSANMMMMCMCMCRMCMFSCAHKDHLLSPNTAAAE